MTEPTFNPEILARYDKVEVSLDVLYRWAEALAGARGSMQGVATSFRKYGKSLDGLEAEVVHVDEVQAEIVAKMKEGMGL